MAGDKISLSIETIRKLKNDLCSRNTLPENNVVSKPILEDGVIRMGFCYLHPGTFLDLFGADCLRSVKKDIPDEQLEEFIKNWEKR